MWAAATTALVLASRGRVGDLGGPIARLGRLRLPFGFTLATAGVVVVLASLPVDVRYHATFGKDVLIWQCRKRSSGRSGLARTAREPKQVRLHADRLEINITVVFKDP